MSVKVKAFLAGCVPFIVAALFAEACPAIRAFDISVHGVGWAVILGTIFVVAIGSAFLEGFVKGLVKGLLKLNITNPVVRIVKSICGWLLVAVAVWFATVTVPGNVAVTAPLGGIAILLLMGIASPISDMIEERVKASANTK